MKKFRSKNLLVTGGAGFIGSNFINYIIHKYENLNIYNLDSLTYAGNLENTKDFKHYSRYKFIHGDICDFSLVSRLFNQYNIDGVINSKDKELLTFEGAIVNEDGVTMTEDDFMLAFKKYRDSTGEYSEWDTIYNKSYAGPLRSKLTIDEIINANLKKEPVEKQEKELFIVIGSDVQGVSSEKLWEKLADRDFQVKESGDSIMYVLGGYDQDELSTKIKELEENNVNVQGIVEISSDDEITSLEKEEVDQIMNTPVSSSSNST